MHSIKVKTCSKVIEKSEVPGDGGGFPRIRFSTNDFSSYQRNKELDNLL